ncbi:MAG: hypothetical protein M3O22_01435 [Pseudomonadota bacterium]|nr:hypothetical protein [Pseudomonadota bacterium]
MSSQAKLFLVALADAAGMACSAGNSFLGDAEDAPADGRNLLARYSVMVPKGSLTWQALRTATSDGKSESHTMGIYLDNCPEAETALLEDQEGVRNWGSITAAHAALWGISRAPGQADDEGSRKLDELYVSSLIRFQNAVEGYYSTLYFAQLACGENDRGEEWLRKWPCPPAAVENLAMATVNLGVGAEQYVGTVGNPQVFRDRNTFHSLYVAAFGTRDGMLKGYQGTRFPLWAGSSPRCVRPGSRVDEDATRRDRGWMEEGDPNKDPGHSISNYVRTYGLDPWRYPKSPGDDSSGQPVP